MNKKSDYFLLGIILMIIGIYTIIEQIVGKNFYVFAYLIVGASLLFLYYTKRKTWALVCSVPIIVISLTRILPNNILQSGIIWALLPLGMSIIFIILFYTKSINTFLIPGCILFWVSLYMIIRKFIGFIDKPSFLPMFIGFSLISSYVLGKHCFGKWLLYFGIFIIAVSFLRIFGISPLNIVVFRGSTIVSILLIIGSIFFIKKGLN